MEKGPLAGPFFMAMTGQDENLEGSAERSGATHTRSVGGPKGEARSAE